MLGFTLLEIMVGMAIMGIVLALGVPAMAKWVTAAKSRSVIGFYTEGLALARQQAIAHNGASRIVFTLNTSNGQYDWQVDVCFPTVLAPNCGAAVGAWSTTTAPAAGDPETAADPAKAAGFRSVAHTAASLPKAAVMAPELLPTGTSSIYFNSLGWVDTSFAQRLSSIRLSPGEAIEDEVRPVAVVIGLAGTAIKCDWTVAIPDSRACPP